MNNDVTTKREKISALADGQLQGDAFADAMQCAGDDEGMATWQLYHMVGDVLRSNDMARAGGGSNLLLSRLREQIAQEAPVQRPTALAPEPALAVVAQAELPAANASVFRWKMVAGVASLAAVAAIGWTSVGLLQGGGGAAPGAQMASSGGVPVFQVPQVAQPSAPVIAVADSEGQQVMIRDPRLDELLAAHKQFGSTSALQMPAGFLRNATFATPTR